MTKPLCLLLSVLALTCALPAFASPALAAVGYQRVGVFAQTVNDGTGVIPTHNGRIAVKTSTGDVYETDTVNDRIDVYRPNGTAADLLTSFGSGDLSDPYGIAIDQSTGDVYVSDSANTRVRKFTSDGAATPTFTLDDTFALSASALAFDQAAHELVYIDPDRSSDPPAPQIKRADSTGAATGTPFNGDSSGTAFTALQDLAVTSTGEIVVVDSTGDPAQGSGESRVERFAANGDHHGSLGPVPGAATVTVIPNGDRIAVSGAQDNVNNVQYATLSVFTNDGVLESSTTSGEQYSIVTGLAADDGANGRLSVASDAAPPWGYVYGNASVQAYEPFTLTTPTVSAVTGDSAHLSASIDPQGGPTTYRFEISTDGSSWTAIDPDADGDENAGSGTGAVTVEADAIDLAANTAYRVRVIATKNAVGVTSAQAQFTSGVIVATVTNPQQAPYQPYEDEGYLNAKVNPRHAPVTVHFEYGLTTSYGKTTNDQAVAAGDSSVNITHHIKNLAAGTTYHFRIVATNAAGEAAGPDQTLTTLTPPGPDTCPNRTLRAQQNTSQLAGCRAYEQVSPTDKAGVSVSTGFKMQAAPDGDAVAYVANSAFPGAATSLLGGRYVARRTGTGWSTDPIDPPQSNLTQQLRSPSLFLSSDLTSTMQFSNRALDGGIDGGGNLYLRNNLTGTRKLVASTNTKVLMQQVLQIGDRDPVGGSPDLSHFAFTTSAGGLVPGIADGGPLQAYEIVDGSVRLVSYLPDGSVAPGGARVGTTVSDYVAGASTLRSVSTDGRRVFFRSPAQGLGALYVRVDGTRTLPISVSQRTGDSAEPQLAVFKGASENGEIVYFTSSWPLTNDIDILPGDPHIDRLYRYNLVTGKLDNLTQCPYDANIGGNISSVTDVSADGSTVYFVSPCGLAGNASNGPFNLFVMRNDELSFVAQIDRSTPNAFGSRNGRYLVFSSQTSAATGYDNENPACMGDDVLTFDAGLCGEVFRYDSDAKKLSCLSCLANPADSRHSNVGPSDRKTSISDYMNRRVLDDGRVFFSSEESLVPQDVNGRQDVYEWQDGRARLISDGRTAADATLSEVSVDGRDVFFATDARLVASDGDDETDLYDARQGGGLAGQNDVGEPVAGCEQDGCQGRPTAAAVPVLAASLTFTGPGDTGPQGAPAPVGRVKVTRPKTVRGAHGSLKVRLPAKGHVVLTGLGLKEARKTVSRAATVTVTVALSTKASRALTKRGVYKTRARVRFSPTGGVAQTATVALTFRVTS